MAGRRTLEASAAGVPSTWYERTVTRERPRPVLAGELRADVCIVGGGFTGLSAALHLAERGYRPVLLEGRRIGWGASGRNGGQIVTGFNPAMAMMERLVGVAAARALWDLGLEAKALLAERVARHAIDCDLVWGHLTGAVRPSHLRELADWVAEWRDRYGYPHLTLLARAEVGRRVATRAYLGGMVDARGGHLNPLALALGLARAAEVAGARLFEGSAVLAATPGAPAVVRTAAGTVRAEFVLLAGNAYLQGLGQPGNRTTLAASTYVGVTEPLGASAAATLIPGNEAVMDMNFVLDYYRRTPDHRLLFGGGVSYAAPRREDITSFLRARMVRLFPQLAGVGFAHAWEGKVAITRNRLPRLARLGRGLLIADGYSGQGVALAGLAGKLMAEAVAGTAERFDLMAAIPHQDFPGPRGLARQLLATAMLWYRLRDRLG